MLRKTLERVGCTHATVQAVLPLETTPAVIRYDDFIKQLFELWPDDVPAASPSISKVSSFTSTVCASWGGAECTLMVEVRCADKAAEQTPAAAAPVDVDVHCGNTRWTVTKKASDFGELLMRLGANAAGGMMRLPPWAECFQRLGMHTTHHGVLRFFEVLQRVPSMAFGDAGLAVGSGCDIPATEERAITVTQLGAVLGHIERWCEAACWISGRHWERLEPHVVNLYDAVDYLVRPATASRQCSFVELIATAPQRPAWFVSHWWGAPVYDFVRCIRQHAADRQLPPEAGYWVCAYANNQWRVEADLGDDPEESSFRKAMELSVGVLSVLDSGRVCYTRVWCAFEIFQALAPHSKVQRGRGEGSSYLYDIYTIGGGDGDLPIGITDGFAEVDVHNARHPAHIAMMKSRRESLFPMHIITEAMCTKVETAAASVEADRRHILNAIVGSKDLNAEPPECHPKYEALNKTLAGRFAAAGWNNAWLEGKDMEPFMQALPGSSQQRLHLNLNKTDLGKRLNGKQLAAALPKAFLEDLWLNCFDAGLSETDLQILFGDLPPRLRCLKLDCGGCPDVTNLADLGRSLTRLQAMTICELYFGRSGLRSLQGFADGMAPLPALTHFVLNVDQCSLKTLEGLDGLLAALPSLTAFSLDCHDTFKWYRPQRLVALTGLQGLAGHPMLDSLRVNLSGCEALESLSTLGMAFVGLNALQTCSLNLSNCKQFVTLDDVGLAVRHARAVKTLTITCDDCTSLSSLDGLMTGLAGLPSLSDVTLSFAGCVALPSLGGLGATLAGLPLLAACALSFARCSGIADLGGLGECLAQCRHLASCTLDFSFCVALATVDAFALALLGLPESCRCAVDFEGCRGLDVTRHRGPGGRSTRLGTVAFSSQARGSRSY